MELTNNFEVAVAVDEAWSVLTDVEKIAPCLPGAKLTEIEGDQYRGIVKVKVGPVTASYQVAAEFIESDQADHRFVLKGEGRETKGQGSASATVTVSLSPLGPATRVQVVTDLEISGKVAQFGRAALADVSEKLIEQFVHNLETTVLAPDGGGEAVGAAGASEASPGPSTDQQRTASTAAGSAAHGVRRIDAPEPEPVDLLNVAAGSLAEHLPTLAGIAGALVLLGVVIYSLRRRRR